ncbi:cytosine deaminase, partial [Consotaella sp. CSK11QG-6]
MSGFLIRNAHVIASPHTGELGKVQSILIEDDRISALGEEADAQASDVRETMDAEGRIIVPGLVNAHMHSWQAPLRGIALDWNLLEYLAYMHGQVVPKMTPDDVHIGTLAAAVTQIAS